MPISPIPLVNTYTTSSGRLRFSIFRSLEYISRAHSDTQLPKLQSFVKNVRKCFISCLTVLEVFNPRGSAKNCFTLGFLERHCSCTLALTSKESCLTERYLRLLSILFSCSCGILSRESQKYQSSQTLHCIFKKVVLLLLSSSTLFSTYARESLGSGPHYNRDTSSQVYEGGSSRKKSP